MITPSCQFPYLSHKTGDICHALDDWHEPDKGHQIITEYDRFFEDRCFLNRSIKVHHEPGCNCRPGVVLRLRSADGRRSHPFLSRPRGNSLGPSGAGKTTSVTMLTGPLLPQSGQAMVLAAIVVIVRKTGVRIA